MMPHIDNNMTLWKVKQKKRHDKTVSRDLDGRSDYFQRKKKKKCMCQIEVRKYSQNKKNRYGIF